MTDTNLPTPFQGNLFVVASQEPPRRRAAARKAAPKAKGMPRISQRALDRAKERPGVTFDHSKAFAIARPMPE